MYGRSGKRHPKWAVCAAWVAGLGAWSFNSPKTAPTHRVPLWASPLRGGERNVWQGKKYHSLVFSPSASLASVCLAAALKCFHENSEAEQVGVVAPGVGTAKHDEDTMWEGFFFFFFVISASAAYEHCQAVIIYGCCVALVQNDKFRLRRHTETRSWHIAAGLDRVSLLLLCPRAFCPNQRWAN